MRRARCFLIGRYMTLGRHFISLFYTPRFDGRGHFQDGDTLSAQAALLAGAISAAALVISRQFHAAYIGHCWHSRLLHTRREADEFR